MSTAFSGNSGKLLILAVFAVGLAAAGASWWFRYAATHRAAQFWGREAVRLLRDAPIVEFSILGPSSDAAPRRDISSAPGLTHLRAALLEDRSYDWSPRATPDPSRIQWTRELAFRDPSATEPLVIEFSDDARLLRQVGRGGDASRIAHCEPIASGLNHFFSQLPPPAGH